MANENSFSIVDDAISLAVNDLLQKGLPEDEAHIAMMIRLRHLVPAEIQQVADLLFDDEELNSKLNPEAAVTKSFSASV